MGCARHDCRTHSEYKISRSFLKPIQGYTVWSVVRKERCNKELIKQGKLRSLSPHTLQHTVFQTILFLQHPFLYLLQSFIPSLLVKTSGRTPRKIYSMSCPQKCAFLSAKSLVTQSFFYNCISQGTWNFWGTQFPPCISMRGTRDQPHMELQRPESQRVILCHFVCVLCLCGDFASHEPLH